jgi:hypothetical protein
MPEHLVVLLVPGVGLVPVEGHVARQLRHRLDGIRIGPDRVLVPAAAGHHRVVRSVTLVGAVGAMAGRFEQIEPDVFAREVIDR